MKLVGVIVHTALVSVGFLYVKSELLTYSVGTIAESLSVTGGERMSATGDLSVAALLAP